MKIKLLIKRLEERVIQIKEFNQTMNSASFPEEEGVVISGDEAELIIAYLKKHLKEKQE